MIGARVELSRRWHRSNTAGFTPTTATRAAARCEAHFGLGKHDRADLTVALLNGKSVKFADVRADRFLDMNIKTQTVSILEPPK